MTTTSPTRAPATNEGYLKTTTALREAGYSLIRKFEGPDDLSLWAGRKGCVIVQRFSYAPDGCATFADWPLGHTYDGLKEAL